MKPKRPILVGDILSVSADRNPDKTALIIEGRSWSYLDLENRANNLARSFLNDGHLEKGARALVILPNGYEAVITFFGLVKAGIIATMLHPGTKNDKITKILADCGASAIITDDKLRKSISGLQIDSLLKIYTMDDPELDLADDAGAHTGKPSRGMVIDQDIAFLVYTSGSTGESRGVACPHFSVLSAIYSICEYLECDESDVVGSCLPLAFDHGLYQVLTTFYVGGTLVLERDFSRPVASVRALSQAGITGLPGVPSLFAMLLRLSVDSSMFSNLRYIASTGGPLPVAHIQALKETFPTTAIFSMYGLTECKRASFLPPDELDKRPLSIGRGMANQDLWLVDESGKRVGPGNTGELVIRGSNVMRGYWNRPIETDAVFRPQGDSGERVLYSGDIMRLDDDGYLYFIGRKDDLFKSRGEKVYPREIEDVLYTMPGINEAAVVGIPNELLGNMVVAHVVAVPREWLSAATIITFCRERLESHLIPGDVQIHSCLPKTPSGKIDRLKLRMRSEITKAD